jgi:hypothetical protein
MNSSDGGDDAKPVAQSSGISGVVWFLIFFLLFSVLLMQFILFLKMSALKCDVAATREGIDATEAHEAVAARVGGDPRFRAAVPDPEGVVVGEERIININGINDIGRLS